MKSVLRIDAYDDVKYIEERERSRFVRLTLDQMKIPKKSMAGIFEDNSNDLSIDSKIKLRSILKSYDISIIEAPNGNIKIYHKQQVVAEWIGCTYILKLDYKSIDPKRRHYTEMTCTSTSIYDQEK